MSMKCVGYYKDMHLWNEGLPPQQKVIRRHWVGKYLKKTDHFSYWVFIYLSFASDNTSWWLSVHEAWDTLDRTHIRVLWNTCSLCTQDGPALGGPYGGGQGGVQKGWIWACGHLPSVCYWSICQIPHYSSPALLQHFLVEFGDRLFSFLSSCHLFVADTIGCQSISWTIVFCLHANLFQLCPPPCEPMDRSPPGSSVKGILQARVLEWVSMPFSRGSSQRRDRTCVSYISFIGRWVFYH